MVITEEFVTRAAAWKLTKSGWEIIVVHPPGGQGPFTIPKPPQSKAIERGSYHPDIVAIKKEKDEVKILLVECKVNKTELGEDIKKFEELANNPNSLYFICFRCQKFEGGPKLGVDYDALCKKNISELPIEFAFAYRQNTGILEIPVKINHFRCTELSFSDKELLNKLN